MKLKSVVKEAWLNKNGEEKPSLTKEQKAEILGKIAEYNKYSKAIYNENDLIEIARNLSELAENAELMTLAETEDQFDKITVTRNMKELKNLSGQFNKVATEAQAFKQRLTGLYEDMGVILNRYFDIHEINEQDIQDAAEANAEKKSSDEIMKAIEKSDKDNSKNVATAAAMMLKGNKDKNLRPKSSDVKNLQRKFKLK